MKKFKWTLVMLDKNNSDREHKRFRTVDTFYGNQRQVQDYCIKNYNGNFWRDTAIKEPYTMRVDSYNKEENQ